MVIDENNQLRDGNHRFRMLSKEGDASFFYKTNTDDEVNFFSILNILCWELHPDMTKLMEKLWQGKAKKYTEKVTHLFTQNVKTAKEEGVAIPPGNYVVKNRIIAVDTEGNLTEVL